jgi:CelD/BcsL family acetyltransferase involved in cellulose biosynthesis
MSAGSEVSVDVLAGPEALDRLADTWRDLAARGAAGSVFETYEWSRAWWEAIGAWHSSIEPWLVRLTAAGRTVGLLPLMLVDVDGRRVLRFLSAPTADYHDLLLSPEVPSTALDGALPRILDVLERADVIELDELAGGSVLRGIAERAAGALPLAREESSICPFVTLTDDRWVSVAKQERFRRRARQLSERSGTITAAHLTDLTVVAPCLPSFFEMHAAQWSLRDDVAGPFTEAENVRFFEQLAQRIGGRGWLVFSRLMVQDRCIAQAFNFGHDQRLSTYRSTFARDMTHYSPGHLLLQRVLAYARGSGMTVLDFLRGEYPYKYLYATGDRRNLRLRSPNATVPLAREDGILVASSLRPSRPGGALAEGGVPMAAER